MQRQDRISEVYEAALNVFSEFGYKKATIEDIADELDLSKGALYQYARHKKDLYFHTVEYGYLNWQKKVFDAVAREADVRKQFEIMCKKACDYLAEDIRLKNIMIHDPEIFPMSYDADPFKDLNANAMNQLKLILEKGISENKFRPMDTDLIARFLFSIYKMIIIDTYILEEKESYIDSVISIITHGFFTEQSVGSALPGFRENER